jgi:type I restriction enzyme M protein
MKMVEKINIEPIANSFLDRAINIMKDQLQASDYHYILYLLFLHKQGIKIGSNDAVEIIHNSKDEEKMFYHITSSYLEIRRNISLITYKRLAELVTEINVDSSNHIFSDFFEHILNGIFKISIVNRGLQFIPKDLIKIASNLVNLNPGSKVFNPFSGLGDFGIIYNDEIEYYGKEINHTTWVISSLRYFVHGINGTHHNAWGNVITQWQEGIFDLIISCPPIGAKINEPNIQEKYISQNIESYVIERSLDSMHSEGKGVFIISNKFLFSNGSDKIIREKLIKNDFIEKIISLPAGLLSNSNVQLNIIVLNKKKENSNLVQFIDVSEFSEHQLGTNKIIDFNILKKRITNEEGGVFISLNQIENEDFDLSVKRYTYIDHPLDKISGQKFTNSKYANRITGNRVSEGIVGKFIRIRNLKDDQLEYQLNINEIEEVEIPRNAIIISESCLLIATKWRTFKPTYFQYDGTPVYITNDIFAYIINTDNIEVGYLINELLSDYVEKQANSFRVGTIVPSIKEVDLNKIEIHLPLTKKEQSEKLKLLAERYAQKKVDDLVAFSKLHGLKEEMYEHNSYLRHTLAGPVSNLLSAFSNIKYIFNSNIINKLPSVMELKVSENHLSVLSDYFKILERDLKNISEAVRTQLLPDIRIDQTPLEQIDFINFFDSYIEESMDKYIKNFSIVYNVDELSLFDSEEKLSIFINANPKLLIDLFDNLIDNCIKHAFIKEQENRIEIMVRKSIETKEGPYLEILFGNTGKPFPSGFTINEYIRKGSKSVESNGDGFGGWYVNAILNHFSGNFKIINEDERAHWSGLTTTFEILIPIL